MLAVAGYFNGQGSAYFVVSVGGTASHLVWQYMTVDLDVPKSCWSESFLAKFATFSLCDIHKITSSAMANSDGLCGED